MVSRIDKEKTKKNIALILDRVKTETDPHLLNEYRAFFKKGIPFFRRSWAAAYLLMYFDQGGFGQAKAGSSRRETRIGPRQNPLTEEESKRLFISIGRNRRVSPREILRLICSRAGVVRDDIGAIRILDNYSFVQVREAAAETIIEALNGQNFRGRTLTVNYAKNRRDGGEESIESSDNETAENDEDYMETEESELSGDSGLLEQDQNQSDKEDI
jgi:RNA recognition motif-containing protein